MKYQNFCVLPFFAYETDGQSLHNIYCCRWPKGTDVDEVRQHIQANKKHDACTSCWKVEDAQDISERMMHNRTMDYLLDTDIDELANQACQGKHSIKMLKLYTSNICNGLCVTCGPEASTAWQKLESNILTYEKLTTIPDVDYARLKYLSLVGGEPLLEKRNWDILEKLKSLGNTDIFVTIVTNGTVNINKHNKKILESFSRLNFCFSIDGLEDCYQYLRFPASWNDLEKNVRSYREITDNISVSTMISNINVFQVAAMKEWFVKQSLPYLMKPIEAPIHFAPWNLPDHLKYLASELSQGQSDIYTRMGRCTSWQECQKEIVRQDRLKNISIVNFLGDWGRSFIDICDKN